MEMGLTVFSLILAYFIMSQQKNINYLSDVENQKDIKALKDLLDHAAFKASGQADDSDEEKEVKLSIGTRGLKNKETQALEIKAKEEKQAEEERLRKEVPMSYVDCDYYYGFNQYYFVFTLCFVLLQGMLNNSCIDIPSLFLILGLAASYPYRKYYTKSVLEYIFFVIYYQSIIIMIKIVQEIFVKIEFI